MTPKRFYQFAFLSPVVFPLVVALPVIQWGALPDGSWLTSAFKGTLVFSLFALIFGGLPYIVLACATLWRLRRQSAPPHQAAFTVLPLMYAPLLWLCYFLFGVVVPDGGFADALAGATSMAVFGLVIGYVYVGVTRLVFWLLQRLGGVHEPVSADSLTGDAGHR